MFKWLAILALLFAAVAANGFLGAYGILWKVSTALGCILAAVLLFFKTDKGSSFLLFVKEAYSELRKIAWPSRQETAQSALIVLVMVLLVALALWLIDNLVIYVVGLVTGLGGL